MTDEQTKPTFDIDEIERFLRVRGWKESHSPEYNFWCYVSPSGDWSVVKDDEGYDRPFLTVCKFTDRDVQVQDVGAVAMPRWEPVSDEVYSLEDMERELVSVGAMEWECPNCGRTGGTPQPHVWREFQGDRAHGGVVEHGEMRCSKCIKAVR